MQFYCNVCDKEFKTNPQNNRTCGKLVQTHKIKNPKISDIKKTFF